MSEDYIIESKKGWRRPEGGPTTEDLVLGCLQRIAMATEDMAPGFIKLQQDCVFHQRALKDEQVRNLGLERRISALRGVISKLKKDRR